jgi:hypothetical protein
MNRFFPGPAIGLLLVLVGVGLAQPHERPSQEPDSQAVSAARTVALDVQTKSWRAKGRVSFPLLAALKMKLKEAGFTVVETPIDSHDLLLKVDYREERGEEYRIDLQGTNITAQITLEDPQLGALLHLTIKASSEFPEAGSRPYVNALERFETNPYFYFLGGLIKSRVTSRMDMTATLIESLARMPEQDVSAENHTLMLASETLHVTWAKQNTVKELGRLKDPRAVPVLSKLLAHQDWRLRLVSVKALGEIGSEEARAAVEKTARQDTDSEVRESAATALARMSGAPSMP